ncbi:lipoyl domain-containing protein [Antiquaquibacter soli]|uniref:Lipoyl domain-containing protein n=1 Tax=Antiquaquibacter soli TaxID=3064523 RepID=A0ABT9BQH9_9MICO|nr:lipoyl domain-containing protein [Protaetiibacter sp. WY-16]MDO7881577.1 lipoyl domain-containing protein [Protaetiibacter sp. WY-16]
MSESRVTMPRVSETIDEFYVVEWLVAEGEPVAAEQVLLRVETDKAIVDVPSTVAGTLVSQLVAVDAEVTTGSDVAVIETT